MFLSSASTYAISTPPSITVAYSDIFPDQQQQWQYEELLQEQERQFQARQQQEQRELEHQFQLQCQHEALQYQLQLQSQTPFYLIQQQQREQQERQQQQQRQQEQERDREQQQQQQQRQRQQQQHAINGICSRRESIAAPEADVLGINLYGSSGVGVGNLPASDAPVYTTPPTISSLQRLSIGSAAHYSHYNLNTTPDFAQTTAGPALIPSADSPAYQHFYPPPAVTAATAATAASAATATFLPISTTTTSSSSILTPDAPSYSSYFYISPPSLSPPSPTALTAPFEQPHYRLSCARDDPIHTETDRHPRDALLAQPHISHIYRPPHSSFTFSPDPHLPSQLIYYPTMALDPPEPSEENEAAEAELVAQLEADEIAAEIAAQEALARDYEPDVSGPAVSKIQSTEVVKEYYATADPVFAEKTEELPGIFPLYRTIRGDGNCGWRAIGYCYFEALIHDGDTEQLIRERARLLKLNDFIRNVGKYETYIYEDMVAETDILFDRIIKAMPDTNKAAEVLDEVFNDDGSGNAIIYHLRLLTASYLKDKVMLYEDFLTHDEGVVGYCQEYIERPNCEIDHLRLEVLASVLLKPIDMVLEIAYLDRSEGSNVDIYRLPQSNIQRKEKTIGLRISLLFRPDHYDILYRPGLPSREIAISILGLSAVVSSEPQDSEWTSSSSSDEDEDGNDDDDDGGGFDPHSGHDDDDGAGGGADPYGRPDKSEDKDTTEKPPGDKQDRSEGPGESKSPNPRSGQPGDAEDHVAAPTPAGELKTEEEEAIVLASPPVPSFTDLASDPVPDVALSCSLPLSPPLLSSAVGVNTARIVADPVFPMRPASHNNFFNMNMRLIHLIPGMTLSGPTTHSPYATNSSGQRPTEPAQSSRTAPTPTTQAEVPTAPTPEPCVAAAGEPAKLAEPFVSAQNGPKEEAVAGLLSPMEPAKRSPPVVQPQVLPAPQLQSESQPRRRPRTQARSQTYLRVQTQRTAIRLTQQLLQTRGMLEGTENNPLRFTEWQFKRPGIEVSQGMSTFRGSRFSTAHFSNPEFQPEEYRPMGGDEGKQRTSRGRRKPRTRRQVG